MPPTTLSFVLRWQAGLFWAGIALASIAGYQWWCFPADTESIGVVSGVSLFGPSTYLVGFMLGIGMIATAWTKAANLRDGS